MYTPISQHTKPEIALTTIITKHKWQEIAGINNFNTFDQRESNFDLKNCIYIQ